MFGRPIASDLPKEPIDSHVSPVDNSEESATNPHLQVGQSGVQPNTPVHQTIGAIDDAIFMKATESLCHSARAILIHLG